MKNFYKKVPRTSRWRYFTSSLLMVLAASVGTLKAQVSGYTFSQSTGSYTELTSGTVLATATANAIGATSLDSGTWPVTLPFPFSFNGQAYTALNVSANGFISFGTTTTTTSSPISATDAYTGAISAFGGDLNSVFNIGGRTGNVSWQTVGTAPNREVVIQWQHFRPAYSTSTTSAYTFSFQIRLQETTNKVMVVYSDGSFAIGSTAVSGTRQIGLRGATNTDFNNRLNPTTVAFTNSTAGTANSSSQAYNTSTNPPGMPTAGLTYTWTPPTCLAPGAVTYGMPSASSVSLSWPAVPAALVGYTIYYSTTNTAPTAATVLDATNSVNVAAPSSSGTISGLTASTQYYVWIRSNCSTTDMSAWSAKGSFVTACPAVTAPWTYTVESAANTTSSVIADCWSSNPTGNNSVYRWDVDGSGSTPSSDTGPAAAYSGVKYFYTEASSGSAGSVAELYTPDINVSALTNPALQFYYHMYGATMGELHVDVYNGSTWTNDMLVLTGQQHTSLTDPWKLALVNLGTLTITGDVKVRFRAIRGTDFYGDMAIDDISILEAPSCFAPSALTMDSFTATTATVSWTAPTPLPTGGYTVYYSTVNTAPTASTVLDATNSVTSTTVSATIPGLTPDTTYYVWVSSNCGTSQSTWTGPSSVYTGYCLPAPSSVDGQGITNVTFGTGTNVVNNTTVAETNNYGNYSSMVGDVPAGVPSQVSITYATGYTYGTKIWVDLNNDLIFDNVTELLYTGLSTATNPTTLLASITIPPATALGNYRMRIGGTDTDAGPGSACYTGTYGTFEDYTVNVTAAPSCLPPTAISVDPASITSGGANINFTASVTAPSNGYTVYYSAVNTAPTASTVLTSSNSVNTTASPAAITGLAPATQYYVWVRTNCATTDQSSWSGPVTFTTNCVSVTSFTENFDTTSTTGNVLPTCWSKIVTGSSANAYVQASTSMSSPNVLYIYSNSATDNVYVKMPQVTTLDSGLYSLKFNGRANFTAGGKVEVGYMTDPSDTASFVVLGTYTSTSTTSVDTFIINITGVPAGVTTLALRHTGVPANSILLDNIQYDLTTSLGTSNVSAQENTVSVYPNPFTDTVNISDAKDLKSVSVIDMSGRLVKTIANPGRQINLSELKAGLYILKLDYQDGTSKSVKAIKK